jgi:coatomer protein complex subunit gamma
MAFLCNSLLEEGGFDFKQNVVDAVIDIIHNIPESKFNGLNMLCEFIEDCEFPKLNMKILHLIGTETPNIVSPRTVIPHVYNRVILEQPQVRAAAVDTLATMGRSVPTLKVEVEVLLRRCLYDIDDEVRDRAIFYLKTLQPMPNEDTDILSPFYVDLGDLESSLLLYSAQSEHKLPFDLVQCETELSKRPPKPLVLSEKSTLSASSVPPMNSSQTSQEPRLTGIRAVPELALYGQVIKSSRPVEITESDSDYVVVGVKHSFENYLVLEFQITNTINSHKLENVMVECDLSEAEGVELENLVPVNELVTNVPSSVYIVLKRTIPSGLSVKLMLVLDLPQRLL